MNTPTLTAHGIRRRWRARRARPALVVVAVALLGIASSSEVATAAQHDTTLVSRVGFFGPGGDLGSRQPAISADGRYVAFASDADNLSTEDNDSFEDVFVRDTVENTVTLVSRASGPAGVGGDEFSDSPSISADGRFVAFRSEADNLSPTEDNNGFTNIFVRDMQQNTLTLVSRVSGATGTGADSNSAVPAISADGRYVAFESDAQNLSTEDVAVRDIFVRDTLQNTTTLVSRENGATGPAAGDNSSEASISADGRFVAFESNANNLTSGENEGVANVFLRDTQQNTTTFVSRESGAAGPAANGLSADPSISADGRFVAFESFGSNLSTEDDDGVTDVFVRDMQQNTLTYASRATGVTGAPGELPSLEASISSDGRFVTFRSSADNLSTEDNDVTNVFVRDIQLSTLTLVSRESGATGAGADASATGPPAISSDGRFVAYPSDANNLSTEDNNNFTNIFMRDLFGTPPPAPLPQGPPGPQGPQGDQGPQGPPGAPGQVVTRDLLAIALALDKLSARQGRRVTLPYAATLGGRATLEVLKGSRVVATVRGTAKAGRNTIRWNGQQASSKSRRGASAKAPAAGKYTLRVTVVSADGQSATDRARLTLRKRR